MKITVSQEEITKIVREHLIDKGYLIDINGMEFKVEWNQQYDTKPTNIEIEVSIF